MTGAYLRIKRDGKWGNVEVDQLTDEELENLAEQQPERGWTWARFLAKWIRDNVLSETELNKLG